MPGWGENPRQAKDDTRWHEQLARLETYRKDGYDWPRHLDTDTELEHTLDDMKRGGSPS